MSTDDVGEQLAEWGVVARIETRGRTSGRPVAVAVGYVEERDGAWLVAAGEPDADWARNLETDPHARVTIGRKTLAVDAERLEGVDAQQAVVELILKYGTSAERLGRGPVFRLTGVRRPLLSERGGS